MTNFNSELFQARFDAAVAGLQSVFTDLLLHTDSLDEQLQQHERKITALEEKIAYLEAAIERLSR